MRPVYAPLSGMELSRGPNGHAGLWYDRFCERDASSWKLRSSERKDSGKLEWISMVTKSAVGESSLIDEACNRLVDLVIARKGCFAAFVTESRFVTGLGRSHPVENGFAWHPTFGVPFVPGSSIKGLVRARCRETQEERVDQLFGTSGREGAVIVLDALPLKPVMLEADVLTPHYAGWTVDDPPGDWRSPGPVPFLVVAERTNFVFAFVPTKHGTSKQCEEALELLEGALGDLGAGAKTASGYGRLRHDAAASEKLTKLQQTRAGDRVEGARRRELERTPEGRWSLQLERKSEADILDLVRINLQKQRLGDPEQRKSFAKAVEATGLLDYWRQGRKRDSQTPLGRDKLRQRAELVDAEL